MSDPQPSEVGEADVRAVARLLGTVLDVRPERPGGDHVAWRVDTPGGAWVLRRQAVADGSQRKDVRTEAAVMDLVRHAVGGWVAEAVVLDRSAGWIAHRRVGGEPLQDLLARGTVPGDRLTGLAVELGRFVRRVAEVGVGTLGVPIDDTPLEVWAGGLGELLAEVRGVLGGARTRAVERFAAAPPPDDPHPSELALVHGDLGAEHVVVDPATLAVTGVIDWSDAAVADPAADLGRLQRDLGEAASEAALAELGQPADEAARLRARASFYARCLVVEDVAHAVRRRPDLLALGIEHLDRLYGAC